AEAFVAELWRTGATPLEWELRLLALTTTGDRERGELLHWARWGASSGTSSAGARFTEISGELALAEAFGDTELADELRSMAGRFRAAFLQRDMSVALAFVEDTDPRPLGAERACPR